MLRILILQAAEHFPELTMNLLKILNRHKNTVREAADKAEFNKNQAEGYSQNDTVLITHESSEPESAYLTDEKGRVYAINGFPFVIGRRKIQDGTSLSIADVPEISGIHAAITLKNGKYRLEDRQSTNGTFIKKEGCELFSDETRVTSEVIEDGSVFWLYRTEFTFHTDSRASQTCIVSKEDLYQTSKTLPVDSEENDISEDKCLAYLTEKSSGTSVQIFRFPFSYRDFTIKRTYSGNRFIYCIFSEKQIMIEGEQVTGSGETEIFSGCNFTADYEGYTFYIK